MSPYATPDAPRPTGSSSSNAGPSKTSRQWQAIPQPDTVAIVALAFLLGSATALGASSVYRRFFKRIENAEWITPDLLKRKRWITGVVTSVGDADNFRLYHTPGFGWRGPFKFRSVPTTYRELKGRTIHIRMAGMDAPEASHFGRPAQPYATDALAWLKDNIEGRRIKCQLLRRDQYRRVVALPLLPRRHRHRHRLRWGWGWGWKSVMAAMVTRNLPLEMVRAGWGVVYTQSGAEYGGNWEKETYLVAEAEARAARRGIWQGGTDIESPSEYKKRYRMAEGRVEEEVEQLEVLEPEVEEVGLLGRILRRIKRFRDKTPV